MAICIAVFVYINYFSKDNKTSEAMHLGALYTPYVKNRGEYWRFITSAFIHTEFLHLFMNMYCIFYLGRMFETLLGPVRYLILVLVSIVIHSLLITILIEILVWITLSQLVQVVYSMAF